jgi:hypothetical protein
VTPDEQTPPQRPGSRDPHETRRMQARLFLAVAALFLVSAVTQWANAEDTSDRVWTGVLAAIAIGVGIYFWRVLREERPPDDDPS